MCRSQSQRPRVTACRGRGQGGHRSQGLALGSPPASRQLGTFCTRADTPSRRRAAPGTRHVRDLPSLNTNPQQTRPAGAGSLIQSGLHFEGWREHKADPRVGLRRHLGWQRAGAKRGRCQFCWGQLGTPPRWRPAGSGRFPAAEAAWAAERPSALGFGGRGAAERGGLGTGVGVPGALRRPVPRRPRAGGMRGRRSR